IKRGAARPKRTTSYSLAQPAGGPSNSAAGRRFTTTFTRHFARLGGSPALDHRARYQYGPTARCAGKRRRIQDLWVAVADHRWKSGSQPDWIAGTRGTRRAGRDVNSAGKSSHHGRLRTNPERHQ